MCRMNLNKLFSQWDQIHLDTLATLELFDESELKYSAFEDGWCVGEIALHIANSEEGWFRVVAQRKYSEWPSSHTLEFYPTKEKICNLLESTHKETMLYLGSKTIEDLEMEFESEWGKFSLKFIIWHVIEHEIHHRGELSLILGLMGRGGLDV